MTVVTSRFIGIDLLIDGRHTYAWGSGLLGNPMTPCDVIRVYRKMNWNFKGGTNKPDEGRHPDLQGGRIGFPDRCA